MLCFSTILAFLSTECPSWRTRKGSLQSAKTTVIQLLAPFTFHVVALPNTLTIMPCQFSPSRSQEILTFLWSFLQKAHFEIFWGSLAGGGRVGRRSLSIFRSLKLPSRRPAPVCSTSKPLGPSSSSSPAAMPLNFRLQIVLSLFRGMLIGHEGGADPLRRCATRMRKKPYARLSRAKIARRGINSANC